MGGNNENEDLELNAVCWDAIFERSVDKEQIDAAISCIRGVVERQINRGGAAFTYQDTYANLLFKAGRTEDAIIQEEEAIKGTIEWRLPESYTKDYRTTLEKIRQNVPTWPRYIDKGDVF